MVSSTTEGNMAKQQPSYSKEFKQEAVRLVETSGKGKSAVARGRFVTLKKLFSKWESSLG